MRLPEILFSSSQASVSKQLTKLEKSGTIRKIAPRLYTSNLEESPEAIVRRNLFTILGHLYPGALLSHRSALEFQPTASGQLFVTYKYTRRAELPGVTVRLLAGEGTMEGDNPVAGELYASQRERAFLENFQPSRQSGSDSKTLSFAEIEERLEQIIRVNGEAALNEVRDRARQIAEQLAMPKEFAKLDRVISALLSTRPSKILTSPVAAARAFGVPYDPSRVALFETLFRELHQQEFRYREEANLSLSAFQSFAFFESYFSNYIEGTVFEVAEARQIIETQRPIPARNQDSHDILGTYRIVADQEEMQRTPGSPEELINLLMARHAILLAARPDIKPGEFKDKNNFAGQTAFVEYELVRGTLMKSYDFYQALSHPFAKAAYIMFVVSEVHPFLDGNGRIARVMMNAELVKARQAKIIIPTVYRDDYMGALRRLTRRRDPSAYVRMLSRAHAFSATIVGETVNHMQTQLERSNAFLEHTEGKLKILA
ncbi:Fic family protein [Tunicatimonas pelagia]|uniref:Fic family protein n=1 Tax=Tunicatimonas pelagia TaxID=931531 RepID=UPI00266537E0|nr:Fic family protein [Tunicatimonas pelagia]WKN44897.1 Fic family protein [Tunicatimonas pelagia]